ncbi:hypothetical protein KVR01_012735 [Diaporthe batatas]|uniref:uncharacterized protein n=1 Tax=Diaporthe batatas TaxID=748121 RepID=UPI001D04D696|nr:uncharacterized protein KVR01_012735 [Diaporthe batatas]KAG8157351.1 hypothetical protein KVR01_012735 [Diaporthe batatas]
MGDKPKDPVAEEIRSILSRRVSGYELLLLDYVTPLLHKELLDATKQNEEILQRPDPTTPQQQRAALQQLGHLDNLDEQISEHWKDLHRGIVPRTALFGNLIGYQWFLAKSIILDYAGHSQREINMDSWVSRRIEELDLPQKTGGESKNDRDSRIYQQTIATPIKELMLDQGHVEKRIRLAAAEPYPTGQIYRLIDECDWSTLAMMLSRDRELAVTLYSGKPLDPKSYDDNIAKIVLREMDEVRDRYFTELSSPSTYTTSKHAQERSARKEAGLPLEPVTRRRQEGDWVSAAAKGIFNKVVSSLGLGAGARPGPSVYPSPSGDSSRPSIDSTTHLLSSKDRQD